jgi:hypothetical protein
MKKVILILVIITGISTGCERSLSTSTNPTFFVVQTIHQDSWDKQFNVAEYILQMWTTDNKGTLSLAKTRWYTLQEGFQVGDTLVFTQKKRE